MSNNDNLRQFVVFDEDKPSDFDMMLEAIEFMQEELGVSSNKVPSSYEDALRIYADLKTKVLPPTDEQLRQLQVLLEQTGSVLSGKLHSRAQVSLLIEAMQDKALESSLTGHDKWKQHGGTEKPREHPYNFQEGKTPAILWTVVATVGVAMVACSFFWPDIMLGVFYLIFLIGFVVGGGIWVLRLWR